jgi:hypothetical protein
LIWSELISYHAPQKKQDAFLACSIWMLTLVHVNICPSVFYSDNTFCCHSLSCISTERSCYIFSEARDGSSAGVGSCQQMCWWSSGCGLGFGSGMRTHALWYRVKTIACTAKLA